MSFTTAALLTAWVAIALLAIGFAGLMRQLGDLRRAGAGTATRRDSAAPDLRGLALPTNGDLGALRPHGGGLLVFVSPGCASCEATLAEIAATDCEGQVVIASSGPCPSQSNLPGAACVGEAMPLMERLKVPGTPYLMHVDQDGVIGQSLLPHDVGQVRDFLTAHRTTSPRGR